MWPIILSNRLPIVALVGRYPANKLMGRGLIPARKLASRGLLSPHCKTRAYPVLSTVSSRYSSCRGRSSTRYSPVRHSTRGRSPFRVRLACVKHAASVQSEPESNSPVQICSRSLLGRNQNLKVVLFPFALRLSMNQADLRPLPFLAALGLMNLFRGAVNSFFANLEKTLRKSFLSSAVTTGEGKNYACRPLLSTTFFHFAEKWRSPLGRGPASPFLAQIKQQGRPPGR